MVYIVVCVLMFVLTILLFQEQLKCLYQAQSETLEAQVISLK